MTKQFLENEVQRLKEELKVSKEKEIELENKSFHNGQIERCRLYDEIFFSIKSFLESGGEIILRPRVAEVMRGEE